MKNRVDNLHILNTGWINQAMLTEDQTLHQLQASVGDPIAEGEKVGDGTEDRGAKKEYENAEIHQSLNATPEEHGRKHPPELGSSPPEVRQQVDQDRGRFQTPPGNLLFRRHHLPRGG